MSTSALQLIRPHFADLGDDFVVRRLLPSVPRQMIGPFIFFDHFGPTVLPPGKGMDVRPHPHIGLATVTYLFEGAITHRDSLGNEQVIRPGDVNWMTAGRGIAHSERSPTAERAGVARLHGLQTWVALPQADEETEPGFFHHPVAALPMQEQGGVRLRVIAGHAFRMRSPVQTFSDTLYTAAEMAAGSKFILPAEHEERGIYVVEGEVSVAGQALPAQHMAVVEENLDVEIRAGTAATLMLLGGEKVTGRRYIWWNFVSSSKERIEAAKEDWRARRFAAVPGEIEFIPLPER